MAWRVVESDVRAILPDDFPTSIKLKVFIDDANTLTNKVSANDSGGLLNAADLKGIERYLAAWLATDDKDERLPTSEKQLDASATYEPASYLKKAQMLDVTGFLKSIEKGRLTPVVFHAGKPVSEQIPYWLRD